MLLRVVAVLIMALFIDQAYGRVGDNIEQVNALTDAAVTSAIGRTVDSWPASHGLRPPSRPHP